MESLTLSVNARWGSNVWDYPDLMGYSQSRVVLQQLEPSPGEGMLIHSGVKRVRRPVQMLHRRTAPSSGCLASLYLVTAPSSVGASLRSHGLFAMLCQMTKSPFLDSLAV